jgi:ketosteroid isomerase-like protein
MIMIWKHESAMLRQAAVIIGLILAALLVFGKEATTMNADEKATETRNKQAVQAGFDAWRKGTGSVFDLLAPDAKWTIVGTAPVSRTYASRQEFLDLVITPFNARLSSRLVPAVRNIYADGDMVIALFDAEGTARDGKLYRNTYTWYLQMREGRIIDVIAFFDTIEFTDLWTRVKPQPS